MHHMAILKTGAPWQPSSFSEEWQFYISFLLSVLGWINTSESHKLKRYATNTHVLKFKLVLHVFIFCIQGYMNMWLHLVTGIPSASYFVYIIWEKNMRQCGQKYFWKKITKMLLIIYTLCQWFWHERCQPDPKNILLREFHGRDQMLLFIFFSFLSQA